MGSPRDNPEIDPLAVLHLDNQLLMTIAFAACKNPDFFLTGLFKMSGWLLTAMAKFGTVLVLPLDGMTTSWRRYKHSNILEKA